MIEETNNLEHVKFKEDLDPSLNKILHLINLRDVTFSSLLHEQWDEWKLSEIFPSIVGWKVVNLELCTHPSITAMNENNSIIKEIHHIHFPLIRVLNLKGNLIESIEPLSRMNLRLMEIVYLCTSGFIQSTTTSPPLLKLPKSTGLLCKCFHSVLFPS